MDPGSVLLHHLDADYAEPIRDPVWGHIYINSPMTRLIGSDAFRKLARIRQLGPAYFVYPGATHTRFLHSLGVFHLARRFIAALLKSPAGGKELGERLTEAGLNSFLTAALLHDLGHFPFAHSLKELPLKSHESLTAEIIMEGPVRGLVADCGADPYMTAAIVDRDLPYGGNRETVFFRNLLSGVLDPDKLDYLNRDAYFCGVPYGLQDVDFAISKIRPLEDGVALDSKGIPSVENILFSKYQMYRAVYWHRDVRAATSMIKKAVYFALAEGAMQGAGLYGLDDDGFVRLAEGSGYPPFSLVRKVMERNLHTTVVEARFDRHDSLHAGLLDLAARSAAEKRAAVSLGRILGRPLNEFDVVIDVPEPINFESRLRIVDEDVAFGESSTVFKQPVVDGFADSLRSVRLFCSEPVRTDRKPTLEELVR
jgi:uncharacterized protein